MFGASDLVGVFGASGKDADACEFGWGDALCGDGQVKVLVNGHGTEAAT